MLDTLVQDTRFGIRTLTRSPGFAITAVLALALGIAANTAIFSAANAFLFRPLPFQDADRLVMLYETNPEFNWTHADAAPANALDWREQVEAFEDLALYSEFRGQGTWIRDGEPELVRYVTVSGNFFQVLGAEMALGPGMTWANTWEDDARAVVISHGFWQSHFGGDPGVIGQRMEISSQSLEIVGVAAEGFSFPNAETQIWSPYGWAPGAWEEVWFRRAHFVRAVARLAPGATLESADAGLQVVVSRLQEEYPATNSVMGAGMMPLRSFLTMDVQRPLYVLLAAVGLLLLLACANVANLLLVRANDRAREVSLRYALGAGRARVARQMVTEGLVLAGAGGALGLALGWVGIKALAAQQPVGIVGATSLALDVRVVAFTLITAGVAGVLSAAAPAWRVTHSDVHAGLKDGGRSGSRGRTSVRASNGLVALEVALSVLIVVGAGLMVRSVWLIRDVDPGFQPDGVVAVQFGVPSARYAERDDVWAFNQEFIGAMEARPGIEAVGIVQQLPLAGTSWSSSVIAEDWEPERVGFEILHRRADAGYFDALGIPLVQGRMFADSDGADDPLVVLVNETFAEEHFPGEDPIGKRIAYERRAEDAEYWYEIIGIVGDQHQASPSVAPRAEVFELANQDWGRTNWMVIRGSGDPDAIAPMARAVLRELDPLIPISQVRPLRQVWRASMQRDEFLLTLLGAFGLSALLLAALGVYGVTAQAATRRSHEIGIRMALGAERGQVLGMIVRQGMGVVGIGLVAGLGAALVATRGLESLLFQIEPTDPLTLGGVGALLGGVAVLACLIPARKAARIDPAETLRRE